MPWYSNAYYHKAGGDSNVMVEKLSGGKARGKADKNRNIRRIRNQKVT